jgi:hypothetical protein
VVAAWGLACHAQEPTVLVRGTAEGGTPLPGLHVTAYPFDPDQLLDSLASAASEPRPQFPGLLHQLETYEPPENGRIEAVSRPWRALRDTVARLADSLNAADRRTPGYASAYARFRELYTRLAQRAVERDAALRELGSEDVAFARRAQAAAESLRTWEYEAYASYPEIAERRVAEGGRSVHEGTSDANGLLGLDLEPGQWWLIARWPDPQNPFLEYYWNAPITLTAWLPLRIPLSTANAERRWRY